MEGTEAQASQAPGPEGDGGGAGWHHVVHIKAPGSVKVQVVSVAEGDTDAAPGSIQWWVCVIGAVICVAFAGLMSGLTIGLLSLQPLDLEVIARSADAEHGKMARDVKEIIKDQHFLLVTLLLCNAAAMEGLPVLLDDIMGPLAAVVLSVTAVLLFGEIIPQAVCKSFGLRVGAATAPLVRVLLIICSPIAWPIAKVLDAMFGSERGPLYRRSEISSLVSIEREHGELTEHEADVMEGALAMASKRCSLCMKGLDQVHCLSEEAVLDEATMDWMLGVGRSRIPVHKAGEPGVLLGAVLLKKLIKFRPEDATAVAGMSLSPLVHTSEDTHLYDLLRVFQTGCSHMAAVYARDVELPPGRPTAPPPTGVGALGIITLEDVIEELIKSQIVDECDAGHAGGTAEGCFASGPAALALDRVSTTSSASASVAAAATASAAASASVAGAAVAAGGQREKATHARAPGAPAGEGAAAAASG